MRIKAANISLNIMIKAYHKLAIEALEFRRVLQIIRDNPKANATKLARDALVKHTVKI